MAEGMPVQAEPPWKVGRRGPYSAQEGRELSGQKELYVQECQDGEFPGGPVVRALRFHCRGHGFDPWSGN